MLCVCVYIHTYIYIYEYVYICVYTSENFSILETKITSTLSKEVMDLVHNPKEPAPPTKSREIMNSKSTYYHHEL